MTAAQAQAAIDANELEALRVAANKELDDIPEPLQIPMKRGVPHDVPLLGDKDILAVFNLAKQGLARLPKNRGVALPHAHAYKRVRAYLVDIGLLPK